VLFGRRAEKRIGILGKLNQVKRICTQFVAEHCIGDTGSMGVVRARLFSATLVLVWLSTSLGVIGCSLPQLPPGAVGNPGKYNYSPSVIETGNTRQFWWCSHGRNPNDSSQDSDVIYYASMNLTTKVTTQPILVLAETPGAWDSVYACNPKVVGGIFENPLGDGQNYSYAMYYVATNTVLGIRNGIGVAFSTDGINWKKYPQPVIPSTSQSTYGAGQPALYNTDHKAAITVFYEDSNPYLRHVEATSTDGLHFTVQGALTENGLDLDDPDAIWGDMSYDAKAHEWYAVYNRPLRPPATTGNIAERGQYGVELYKIPENAILTGSSPWQQLATMDTNSTGFEVNFIAGFVRDMWGSLNLPSYPTIQMYTSVSYPAPSWDATPADAGTSAKLDNWILYPMSWAPDMAAALPINQYFNGKVHQVTTGWISPQAGFQLQQVEGHLAANPLNGAMVSFYGCKAGQSNYFVSLDVNCEGQRALGREGYGYSKPAPGLSVVALYRCSTANDHFVSQNPKCEGGTTAELLGYVAP
jgi:hypothetical protein